MRLADYRKSRELSQQETALALGTTQPTISFIERHPDNSIPGSELMLRIYHWSFGAVTPNDFYNLPVLEQLALPMEDQKPAAPAPTPLFDRAMDPAPQMAAPA